MNELRPLQFPKNFTFGAATAAYQIEGAWEADGKGPSIWDTFSHRPGATEHGDVACDHFHRYPQDVALMREIGLQAYRFSLCWPRILPEGRGRVEPRGIAFYDRLIDSLLAAGITPYVTLFHWDLPQALWDQYRGFLHPDTTRIFADYAALCFERFGDRVQHWITHNEPRVHTNAGYAADGHAPGHAGGLAAAVRAEHHILLSHARAVQAFRASGRPGRIGITLSTGVAYPLSSRVEDAAATANAIDHDVHWNLDVLFRGAYPEVARRPQVAALLPESTGSDCAEIHRAGTDFIGVNHYRANWAEADPTSAFGYRFDYSERCPVRETNGLGWPVVPEGMHDTLMLIARRYPKAPILITENGYADSLEADQPPKLQDPERIRFLHRYLAQVRRAMDAGAPVEGYFVWSLMDNFEWGHYAPRFGLIGIDYRTQARALKDSALWYRDLIRSQPS